MMKHAALFTLISLALTCPVIAKSHHAHHHVADKSHHSRHYAAHRAHHGQDYAARNPHRAHHHDTASNARHEYDHDAAGKTRDAHHLAAHATHSGITCEMVRAYVAKVGLGQAMAMAKSAGISAADELRARQCLANKI
jgi:hypothetical protein